MTLKQFSALHPPPAQQKGESAYEAHAFGSCVSSNDGDHQRLVGQCTEGTGASRVCSLDLGLLSFNECPTVVLRVVKMVLEPCTRVVPRLGGLELGLSLRIA